VSDHTNDTLVSTSVDIKGPPLPAAANVVNSNFDGLPDKLTDFLTNSDFKSDWRDRKKVIFLTLSGLGVLLFAMIFVVLFDAVLVRPMPDSVRSLMETILWNVSSMFIGVFTVYMGGAHMDVRSFRNSSVSIINSLSSGMPSNNVNAQGDNNYRR
jgi:hypothetical protein